jgi:hypothetical protein
VKQSIPQDENFREQDKENVPLIEDSDMEEAGSSKTNEVINERS